MEKTPAKLVEWTTFVWAISIMLVLVSSIGAVAMAAQNKAEAAIERISAVEGDIKAINAKLDVAYRDILWIRNRLENGKPIQ